MEKTVLRLPVVLNRTGLSRSTIYAFVSQGRFPKPIPLGARSVGWLNSDIDAWIDQRANRKVA
jgi:prophage regulatory protein